MAAATLLRALALALPLMAAPPAFAQARSSGACAPGATDDTPRPLPPGLVPAFQRAFGLDRMPPEMAQRTTVIRCDAGRLLACSMGANLPCGPADTRRQIPQADAWCRDNGGRGPVPAYVVGHATLYAWECHGGRALPARQVAHADARGFVAEYWRPLE